MNSHIFLLHFNHTFFKLLYFLVLIISYLNTIADGTVTVEIPVSDENYEEISESFLQELEKDDVITLEEYAQE